MQNFIQKYWKRTSRKCAICYEVIGGCNKINDPKHTSRIAKEFLDKNVPEVMDWLSNSLDLNPIENLWAIVKRNVELRRPKNLSKL